MRKLILLMHTSLDGFVAGPNGEMDWINVDEEMFDFGKKLTDEADAALYGRKTYEMMNGYWPMAGDQPNASKHSIDHSKWYNAVTKFVVSRSMAGTQSKNTVIVGDNLVEEITRIKGAPGKNIMIYGSPSAVHTLTQEKLIDEYWVYLNPVILGEGIPLFAKGSPKINLKRAGSQEFSSGVTALCFSMVRE